MPPETHKRFKAGLESLGEAMALVRNCAEANGIGQKRMMDIELATEEALVNIVNHAYPGRDDGYFEISCLVENGKFIIKIVDAGIPFDVMAQKEPDLDKPIAERQVGGLGVFLIRKLMDEVRSRREENFNILELHLYLNP